jgi:hypothetical protein
MRWNSLQLRYSPRLIRPRPRRGTFRPKLELLEDRRLLSTNVLTYHNNLFRTGANLTETTLTLDNVNADSFGKLFDYPVDGQVYAQPLYMANVPMADGMHNVVFVVTEHDSAYAFDANDPTAGLNGDGILWQQSYIDPANGITTQNSSELRCGVITPEIGITDTPVIDPSSGTMYFVAATEDITDPGNPVFHQQLHALDITTGNDVLPPEEIRAGYLGHGDGGNIVTFDPRGHLERNGLVLANGILYTTWSSHCDIRPYHGWLIGYDAQSFQQVAVFNTSPNAQEASMWSGAPAVDASGNMFFVTANGSIEGGEFDPSRGDYPDTVLKLSSATGQFQVADYFTPFNWDAIDRLDRDLGSGSVMLLPDQAGPHQHLLVVAGKEGKIELINRDNMGQFHDSFDDVVQEIPGAIHFPSGAFDSPAFFDAGTPNSRWIYWAGQNDSLKAFQLFDYGLLSTSATSQSDHIFATGHGGEPSVSANGTTNGIVWVIDQNPAGAGLYAYDATNVANELYDSTQAPGGRDQLDGGIKFTVPTIADGEVFVGTADTVSVFGILPGGNPGAGVSRLVPAARGLLLAADNLRPMQVQYAGANVLNSGNASVVTTAPALALPGLSLNVPSAPNHGAGPLLNDLTRQGPNHVSSHVDPFSVDGVDVLFAANDRIGGIG